MPQKWQPCKCQHLSPAAPRLEHRTHIATAVPPAAVPETMHATRLVQTTIDVGHGLGLLCDVRMTLNVAAMRAGRVHPAAALAMMAGPFDVFAGGLPLAAHLHEGGPDLRVATPGGQALAGMLDGKLLQVLLGPHTCERHPVRGKAQHLSAHTRTHIRLAHTEAAKLLHRKPPRARPSAARMAPLPTFCPILGIIRPTLPSSPSFPHHAS